ncbi:hydrophobic surface binding protein A family protein [Metarhizium robertsii]|uniref:Cell wall galactomannoprotein Mp2 n=2 Tax=Metarhizium robertsii TaxID=568076 RepID=E9ELG4_METRA|nr:cell wall galactomannoprotein Mp2 [Metarhizium robertsii ARSEF 23]EFZ03942.1 cell wall galactomannoprotein Mp2 [Metarhizium robertsii ARSEF 23]EXU99091.1 hydrophobic surface binding protein A family protein [Metarhizium robertsii]
MKFSNAVVLAAATGTYAQITVIQGVLTSVGSGIEGLDSAATGFNGDVDAVKSKADALVSAIKSGKTKVDGSSDLTLTDALGLTDPVQSLTKKGQSLADNFKAKRSDVEKAGACDTVRTELSDINTNSKALIDAVVSKVPKDAQTIAQSLAAGLTKVLNQAQDDFSESNCKNSGGSGGSSSKTGGASATSAAAPTTAAATGGHSSASAPATTLAPTSAAPSGNGTTGGNPPPVTAGASFLAPAGALVMAVAAALL